MEYLEYKGNIFKVESANSWYRKNPEYRVSIEKIAGERVWLPEDYKGNPVTEWKENRSERHRFEKVKFLYIPASMKGVEINNDIFPELERVEIDPANSQFVSDGRFIVARIDNELQYCLVCKGDCAEIPDFVREIRDGAFCGTQYEEIKFSGKETKIGKDAFRDSEWLRRRQGEIITIGSVLYRYPQDKKSLSVPGYVRKFHPDLFGGWRKLESLETPVLSSARDIEKLADMRTCRFLTITSPNAHINLASLREWESLESVVIADDHRKYMTQDGVIYSKDKKTLIWYPSNRRGDTFTIPDGVRKIGEFAFRNQQWLREVILPESVTALGIGAFANCRRLEKIELSPGIKEIPDSGAYQGAGVFSECERLKSIVLPEKLNYLGSFAFFESGLTSVTCNKNLEQIGEYALMAKGLKRIALPPGLRRPGRGALFYTEKVEAYEGRRRDLCRR